MKNLKSILLVVFTIASLISCSSTDDSSTSGGTDGTGGTGGTGGGTPTVKVLSSITYVLKVTVDESEGTSTTTPTVTYNDDNGDPISASLTSGVTWSKVVEVVAGDTALFELTGISQDTGVTSDIYYHYVTNTGELTLTGDINGYNHTSSLSFLDQTLKSTD